MRSGSRVVVRRVDEHVVVIDPTRDTIEVRRTPPASEPGKTRQERAGSERAVRGSAPTPDDTVLGLYHNGAVRRVELFVGRDGSHRLVVAIGSREGLDLGAEVTRAQGVELGKNIARQFQVSLDIRDGDYLEHYFRERGPILSRIHDGKHLIEAELVDPIDPFDEISPWEAKVELGYESIERENLSMEDLLIDIQSELSCYDDGPFTEPRVRTAPEVEAVYPLPQPIDPPAMSPEAEAQVRASHRPPRQPVFDRSERISWWRAALKALTA